MSKRYYIAYGSNLSTGQMRYRTPDAKIAGTAILTGWQLLFRAMLRLNRIRKKTHRCWYRKISEQDEKNLDRYEGYPVYYRKRELPVEVFPIGGGEPVNLTAMVYLMADGHPLREPSEGYLPGAGRRIPAFPFPDAHP